MHVELQDAYKHLGQTKSELFSICRKIEKILPNNIAYSFFRRQEFNFDIMWQKEQVRIGKKISNLRAKYIRQEIANIKRINYNITKCVTSEMNCDTSCAPLKLNIVSNKIMNPDKIHSSYKINITPESFNSNFDISNINKQ